MKQRANPYGNLFRLGFLLSFFLFVATVDAQISRKTKHTSPANAPCTLTKDKIAPIRGFSLGQNLSHISLPGIADAYEESASKRSKPYDTVLVSLYDLFPAREPAPPEFSDVYFMLHFFNKRISAIFIGYQEYEAETVREFISSAAPKLGLPAVGWKYQGIFSASLKCADFTASLWTGRYESKPIYQGEPTVSFSDDIAEKEQERSRKEYVKGLAEAKRKRQAEEAQRLREEKAQRKIFKP